MSTLTPEPETRREQVTSGSRDIHVPGSDVRQTIFATCRLCATTDLLYLGHIIPRWGASFSKAEGRIVGDYPSVGVTTVHDDYAKHYLLCGECEQHLGEAENYMSRIVKGSASDLRAAHVILTPERGDSVLLSGLKNHLILRACAGMFLKAHFARQHLFQKVRLGNDAVEELRRMILNDDYDPQRISVNAHRWVNRLIPDVNPRAVLFLDYWRREPGYFLEPFFGGTSWSILVGDASQWRRQIVAATAPLYSEVFFENSDPVRVPVGEWAQHRAVEGTARRYLKLPLDDSLDDLFDHSTFIAQQAWGLDEPCPCGLASTFGKCCAGRWLPDDTRHFEWTGRAG